MAELYDSWLKKAYNKEGYTNEELWNEFMPLEQAVYEDILRNKTERIEGTVQSLADKFGMSTEYTIGFLDGINDSLVNPFDVKELSAEDNVVLEVDFEKLYKKMVEYKAEHLYLLPEWDNVYTPEKRKELFLEQKKSKTVVNNNKIGRNKPCPCGSTKKYKQCCGAL